MKKLLSTMLIIVMAIFMLGTVSKATTKEQLKNYMLDDRGIAGSDLVITEADKVKLERFFSSNEITDAQAGQIKAIIDKAVALMTADGAKEPNKLSTHAKKQQLLDYAQEAASVLGLTVSYDSTETRLDVYRNGVLIESLNWGVSEDTTANKNPQKANSANSVNTSSASATTGTVAKSRGTTEPALARTGSSNYEYVIAGAVALIAGATLVIARKKSVNAIA